MKAGMVDHSFCRALLKDVMVEVRKKFTPEEIKAAWAWDVSGGRRNQFEFHGPNKHYDHDVKGAVDCKWSALANGWDRLIAKTTIKRYQIEQTVSGVVVGIYEGETPDQALDAMAQDAGYKDYDDLLSVTRETRETHTLAIIEL